MKPKIYLPTRLQYAVLPVITAALLAFANIQLIRERWLAGAFAGVATDSMSTIGRYLDSNTANSIGVFIFWIFIGAGAYALIGVLVLIVHPLITMSHVQQAVGHHATKKTRQLSHVLFTRFILRTIAAACLVLWFAVNISFVLRFVDDAARQCIRSGNVFMGFVAIIIGTADMFLAIVITRLLMLKTRIS